MTPLGESRELAIWKAALAPSPACIAIEKLAGPLNGPDFKHLSECPRCEAELALWREFNESAPGAGEGAAVAWIASELKRRSSPSSERGSAWRRLVAIPVLRLSGALTAILLLACGIAMYNQMRPTGPAPGVNGARILRSESVVVAAPVGDLDQRPSELRWQPVAGAVAYQVEILEVDRHSLWKSESPRTSLAIPAGIRSLMAPGKTLLWQVTATNSSRKSLATSGFQKFRVKVKKTAGNEL
jgi:hypothetical protein